MNRKKHWADEQKRCCNTGEIRTSKARAYWGPHDRISPRNQEPHLQYCKSTKTVGLDCIASSCMHPKCKNDRMTSPHAIVSASRNRPFQYSPIARIPTRTLAGDSSSFCWSLFSSPQVDADMKTRIKSLVLIFSCQSSVVQIRHPDSG